MDGFENSTRLTLACTEVSYAELCSIRSLLVRSFLGLDTVDSPDPGVIGALDREAL